MRACPAPDDGRRSQTRAQRVASRARARFGRAAAGFRCAAGSLHRGASRLHVLLGLRKLGFEARARGLILGAVALTLQFLLMLLSVVVLRLQRVELLLRL